MKTAVFSLLVTAFAGMALAGGGPDDYGYYWGDDLDATVSFSWITPNTANEAFFLTPDDDLASIPLPFAVRFYGEIYDSAIYVSTNGLLGFLPTSVDAYFNATIPTASDPNAIICPYWDDLELLDSISHLYYQTEGVAPNRSFVITWFDWFFLNEYDDPEDSLTFQVIIYENTSGESDIKLQYFDPYGGELSDTWGSSATVGIESHTGTDGLQYSYNSASLDSGRAILFYKPVITGHNCAVNAIISPSGSYIEGASIPVSAVISNRGAFDEAVVPTSLDIVSAAGDTVYSQDVSASLLIGEIDTVTFPNWDPTSFGDFNIYCRVSVPGDTLTIDDLRTATATVWEHISWGGPDSAGYMWFDSYHPSGPAYVAPPSLSATIVPELYGDDEYHQIALPFSFEFYGNSHDSIWVSTNGWASFGEDPASAFYTNDSIPGPIGPAGGMLAVFWDDCDADTVYDPDASVRVYDDGGSFWIIWYNIFCPYAYTGPTGQVTFAIRLFPNGIVEYHYEDVRTPEALDHDNGMSATIGIENPTETDGLIYAFNGYPPANPLFDNFAIRFIPPSAGPDTIGPTIAHESSPTGYSDPPDFCVYLTAQITDFNGVSEASLHVTEPISITIPADSFSGSSYYFTACGIYPHDTLWYRFSARDTLGNSRDGSEYFKVILNPHSGGPDMIGYRFVDSWASWDTMAPAYSWFEINPDSGGPGTHLDLAGGSVSPPIEIGGNFPFYTEVARKIVVCKNGWISTDTNAVVGDDYPPVTIPSAGAPNAIIAPLWTYLVPSDDGAISYFDNTAEGVFIVQWEVYDSGGAVTSLVQFQAVIDYTTPGSWITFNYKNIEGYTRQFSGALIEDKYGIDGLAYFNRDEPVGAFVPKSGTSVLFYNSTLYGIEDKPNLPAELAISAYPNPFNAAVSIEIDGAVESAKLDIFDISGRVVQSFELSAGRSRILWFGETASGEGLPSGLYFARLSSEEKTIKRRLMFIK